MDILNQCDIVVDVGAEYDVAKYVYFRILIARRRFDHHQKGFMETFDANHKTKLSSAGLMYS